MVTGHRTVRHPDMVVATCRNVLQAAGPAACISGGAEGADSIFAHVALDCGIPLWLYLPNRWYRNRYPHAVDDETMAAASRVELVVERPDAGDWRDRWDSERWWRDNFARNAAMVTASSDTIVISDRNPTMLIEEKRGGTAACVRDVRRARPERPVVWAKDRPGGGYETVLLDV
jgi:hypothetical protein